jgi:hypothetical protein
VECADLFRENRGLLQTSGIGGDDLLFEPSRNDFFLRVHSEALLVTNRIQESNALGTHAELHRRVRGIVN